MPTQDWVQYGCFSLVAALVIWSLAKGIPSLLHIHQEAIKDLTDTFKAESSECRAERMSEREADRASRHQTAEKMQEAVGELSKIVTAIQDRQK